MLQKLKNDAIVVATTLPLLRCSATIEKCAAQLLIDSGASYNFVSLSFVQNHLQVMPEVASKLMVRLGDGSKVQSQGCVCMLVDFGSELELEIEFEVLDYDIDCVLGMPFLQ